MEHFPDNILTALKEAIYNVFWKKDDLKMLFRRCDIPAVLMNEQNWDGYKIHIITPVLDKLNSTAEGLGPLRRLLQETLAYKDGDHLLWMTDGKKRKREAERSLEHLGLVVKDYEATRKTKEEEQHERAKRLEESKRGMAFQNKLAQIKDRFLAYFQNPNRQERGYALEDILYDLFVLFELAPHGPFRRTGEQIDGSFVHDGDHFLLEAKWQAAPVDLSDLRDLDGAVGSSLDNTLGLFASLNGFSPGALTGYSQGNRPRIICMDGADLMAVLESQFDLSDLLRRKRDVAVQRKLIFAPVAKILKGDL